MWNPDPPSDSAPSIDADFDLEQTINVIVVGTKTGKLSVVPHDHHRRTPDPTVVPEAPAERRDR